MSNHGPLFLLLAGVAVILIVFTRGGRLLAGLALAIVLLIAAYRVFVRSAVCAAPDCRIELQPAIAGPCLPGSGSVVKTGGRYYLTGDAGASAYCIDARFWQ
jgi:hypothetical protein